LPFRFAFFAWPRESWQVAVLVAMELADAVHVSPAAASALIAYLDGSRR
jgi:hypothetical protein